MPLLLLLLLLLLLTTGVTTKLLLLQLQLLRLRLPLPLRQRRVLLGPLRLLRPLTLPTATAAATATDMVLLRTKVSGLKVEACAVLVRLLQHLVLLRTVRAVGPARMWTLGLLFVGALHRLAA